MHPAKKYKYVLFVTYKVKTLQAIKYKIALFSLQNFKS